MDYSLYHSAVRNEILHQCNVEARGAAIRITRRQAARSPTKIAVSEEFSWVASKILAKLVH